MKLIVSSCLAFALLSCSAPTPAPAAKSDCDPSPRMRIDHVVAWTQDNSVWMVSSKDEWGRTFKCVGGPELLSMSFAKEPAICSSGWTPQ